MAKAKGLEAQLEQVLWAAERMDDAPYREETSGLYALSHARLGPKEIVADAMRWRGHMPKGPDARERVLEAMTSAWAKRDLARFLEPAIYALQSPIEETLLYGMILAGWERGWKMTLEAPGTGHDPIDIGLEHNSIESLHISIQPEIASLHPDFLLGLKAYGFWQGRAPEDLESQVAIECDGHDFHERTKEQARRDKRRDRELASAGFPVTRFTGSEVFEDPIGKGRWLVEHASQLAYRPFFLRLFREEGADAVAYWEREIMRGILERHTGWNIEEWKKRARIGQGG